MAIFDLLGAGFLVIFLYQCGHAQSARACAAFVFLEASAGSGAQFCPAFLFPFFLFGGVKSLGSVGLLMVVERPVPLNFEDSGLGG